ncbi:MAG: MaoC family dehydratase [Rhizobiaceae bacterium]
MTLDDYLDLGRRIELGSHRFTAQAIIDFARKYDPQPFHLDEAAARGSLLGGLCASGWHTASVWMKLNLAHSAARSGDGSAPVFGPSPGFRNMKWPMPVFAGETVSYSRTSLSHRALASRPGWRLLSGLAEARDSTGAQVMEFETAVLFHAPQ